ncbi:hypothetical protein G6011_08485 [Alternaria panax]|uniref:Diaminopimelate epimerase-like protein n=1 Tax=Alternaria panax TaxID=48097 RepID=A0AAD4FIF6_9PLEO|nr:hypothetical protein G6011_08485 [Alternaria panax]
MTPLSQLDFVTVDVFTSQPYGGNPLAIVRIPYGRTLTQEQKQTIAREFNLSETTFLHENADGATEDKWTVDIFMTSQELPFAGHPTVGTACYALGRAARERGLHSGVIEASFNLKAGHIHKKKYTKDELFALQPGLAEAHQQGKVGIKEDFAIVSIVKGMTFVLVELESEEALGMVSLAGRSLKIQGLDQGWDQTFVGTYFFVRTGKSNEGVTRLRTRMIEGPLEDPATGSAASDLAAYLSLTAGEGSKTLKYEIVQGVEMGRRSEIFIEVERTEDRAVSQLFLEGGAVQVMEGRLTI